MGAEGPHVCVGSDAGSLDLPKHALRLDLGNPRLPSICYSTV